MILISRIYQTIIFILASILLAIPVTMALKGFSWIKSPHSNKMWLREVLQNYGRDGDWQSVVHSENNAITLSVALALSVSFITFIFKSRHKSYELKYIAGPKLYSGRKAIRHAKAQHRKDLRGNPFTRTGIKVHPNIKITEAREQNNFLINGTTGAGKSTAFKLLVQLALNRGDYAVIYDEKGEYTESFYSPNNTILLAPWDKRSICWNICEDITTKQDAELLALCLIPDSKTPDPIWDQGARVIFVSMLMKLIHVQGNAWGWNDLYKQFMFSPDKARSEFVVHHPIVTSFIESESKTTQGFYVHIMSKLSWIEDLAKAWPEQSRSTFSLKSWLKDSQAKHVIMIQAHSQFPSLGEPLCNAILSLMTKHYLAGTFSSKRKTWLFIDEFANLPRNPNIKKWLELARENGARSVLCTQSISQLHSVYGKEETDSIINLLSNVITFRMGAAGDDAKYSANIFGEYTAETPDYDHPDRIGKREETPVVKASDLVQLGQPTRKGVEGYIQIPGWNAVYKLRWPLFQSIQKAKRKVPAKWVTTPYSKKPVTQKTQPQTNRLNKRK